MFVRRVSAEFSVFSFQCSVFAESANRGTEKPSVPVNPLLRQRGAKFSVHSVQYLPSQQTATPRSLSTSGGTLKTESLNTPRRGVKFSVHSVQYLQSQRTATPRSFNTSG
jgi:hypothetical protein